MAAGTNFCIQSNTHIYYNMKKEVSKLKSQIGHTNPDPKSEIQKKDGDYCKINIKRGKPKPSGKLSR